MAHRLKTITPKKGTPTAYLRNEGSSGKKTTIRGIAVWLKGSSPSWRSDDLSPYNERAAYLIDKMLSLGLVPTTVLRLWRGELVSAQRWVDGNRVTHRPPTLDLFDYIIANNDRHGGNWLVEPNGKVWAIDNAYSFNDEPRECSYCCRELSEVDKIKLKKRLRSLLAEPQKIHEMLDYLIGKYKTDALISRMGCILREIEI